MSKYTESLFAALHDKGWFALSGEIQDALIEAGYHPGPNGGCSRRIGSVLREKVGYCGTDGLCPACWADRNSRVPQVVQVDAHEFKRRGLRWWICDRCYAPRSLHPRPGYRRARPMGDNSYLSADAPHFKEGW